MLGSNCRKPQIPKISLCFLTDHNPLVWLRRQKDPRGKFARWIQELESLEYRIEHVKGVENAPADYLSRVEAEIDWEVNNETEYFERHIYATRGEEVTGIRGRLILGQKHNPATSSAINQLKSSGGITEGQFKNQLGVNLTEGLLCRGRKVIVPSEMKNEILTLVHNEGHLGIDKTTRLVRQQFYWKRMEADIETFCRGCLTCHRNKPKNTPREKLVPLNIASRPREIVAFDVATLPWATNNHRYFLLMVDLFSKFIELYPMADQESGTIVDAIKNRWIYKHGPPSYVLSDQGPNVDSTEVREALAVYGISKRRSSPYHPEGDGQSERGIQSVKQVLRCVLEERNIAKNSWPSLLPEVSYILNSSPNKSFTPYKVMYGGRS